jgi:hypothetical protein
MTAQRERVLLLTRDRVVARVILCDQPSAQVDVRIFIDQRRVRAHLVAPHRHEAHRLGTTGHDDIGKAAHDVLGTGGNGLQS